MPELTDTERDILIFASLQWTYLGAKETAIRDKFGISQIRYAQIVNALIDRPEAMAAHPLTVKRLQRLRDARRAERTRPVPGDRSDANRTSHQT